MIIKSCTNYSFLRYKIPRPNLILYESKLRHIHSNYRIRTGIVGLKMRAESNTVSSHTVSPLLNLRNVSVVEVNHIISHLS